jgi:hypothetical protein
LSKIPPILGGEGFETTTKTFIALEPIVGRAVYLKASVRQGSLSSMAVEIT